MSSIETSSTPPASVIDPSVDFWWHSIRLGPGAVTPGFKTEDILEAEWARLRLSDLTGKTVLDIGAWDGYFSFRSEQAGAKRVVALDHHVWSLHLRRHWEYYTQCQKEGKTAEMFEKVPGLWDPDTLPGKVGFDAAKKALGSKVESVVADFMDVDLETLGRFDVVLYLGVLYHVRHPLLALERLAKITTGDLLIETQAVHLPFTPNASLWEFYPTTELNNDPSNWWAPTRQALIGALNSVGFSKVEVLSGPPPGPKNVLKTVWRGATRKSSSLVPYRLVVRATR